MLRLLAVALLLGITLPRGARADNWATTLGPADTSITIAGSDDTYPFCSTVDLNTARMMATESFPKARAASIAATGKAMEVLARARWLSQMERLWVCTDERGLRALAGVRRLPRLVVLHIISSDGEPLDAKAVRALVSAKALRTVERLRFFGSDSEAERTIGSDGVIALATHARLPHLRFLDVSWNSIEVDAAATLVRSPLVRQLEELNLCRTAYAADALIDANLTNLTRLCASDEGDGRKRLETAYTNVLSPNRDWLDEP